MSVPNFIRETLTATTDGHAMVLKGGQLVRHVFDVLTTYRPDSVLHEVNNVTLMDSRHHGDSAMPIPAIAFLFENLTTLTLASISCVSAPEHQLLSVTHLSLIDVDFQEPLNLFPFINLFPALTDLGIERVQSNALIEDDEVDLPAGLRVLRVALHSADTLDLWLVQWMIDNPALVPEFEHIILLDVEDDTADMVALLLHQEGYHIYQADIVIKVSHTYAYDTLTNSELLRNMQWRVEYSTPQLS